MARSTTPKAKAKRRKTIDVPAPGEIERLTAAVRALGARLKSLDEAHRDTRAHLADAIAWINAQGSGEAAGMRGETPPAPTSAASPVDRATPPAAGGNGTREHAGESALLRMLLARNPDLAETFVACGAHSVWTPACAACRAAARAAVLARAGVRLPVA